MEAEYETESFLSRHKSTSLPTQNSFGETSIEFKKLKSSIGWVFAEERAGAWRAGLSWSVFFLLGICVPLVFHFLFACAGCDADHKRQFDAIVQTSLSLFSLLSFLSLASFTRNYGLKKFLFLDKLGHESERVRQGYAKQIQKSMKILATFVLPCFLVDSTYKIWWLSSGGTQIPYVYNVYLSHTLVCILLMSSWLYRISISFLVCVLFQLTCFLQILRLEDFAQVFEKDSDVATILLEHLSIRRNLRIISHRFRKFILFSLILVTASQFVSLLVTTESSSTVNIFTTGELALCSITLVAGLCICLRSAAKITHKAHSITSLAAKWHACSTVNTFESDNETPKSHVTSNDTVCSLSAYCDSDTEEGDGDDAIDNTNFVPVLHALSYHKRQALVTYFEHNKAGITVYGFMLDRTCLHTIFAIQMSLTLWILNKTISSLDIPVN